MITLTKKEEKLISSLKIKKNRKAEGLFVVEGVKMVQEAIQSEYELTMIVVTESTLPSTENDVVLRVCGEHTMKKISSFKTAPGILAVVKIPAECDLQLGEINVMVDKVQDPGNLGTIIRTAEAFGVKNLICSEDTVDHFSPKVVQASMGSIFRLSVYKRELIDFLENHQLKGTVYAAHLDGDNLYEKKVSLPLTLIVGNESKGIDDCLLPFVTEKIKIPISGEAESFNVSIATAIVLSEFKRQLSV